jgi:hypothetical protein
MAKNLGTFTFAANFQVKAAEALDPRMVAASKADLINKANWPSDGDTIYVYNGLIVDCGADGVYRLIDKTKALATDYSGWERIDAGGVKIDNIFTYKGSVASYTELPVLKNTGDVYNIESAFTLTTGEGETAISYDYPAGTNVAWNGTSWDPLAGSIDLSAYATKEEVSIIRTDVAANATNISNLSTALGNTNLEVAKKVDAVEGSSLITAEKLALIDTNAADIQTLENQNLDSRISTLEGKFKDGDTDISLTNITSTLTEHTTKLTALESDNTTNKTNISNLQTQVENHGGRLTEIETLNSEQSTQLSSLTTRVENVEKHGEAITNLTTTVNGHTGEISEIKTTIQNLAVKSVKTDDQLITLSNTGEISSTIAFGIDETAREDGKKYIYLTGKDNQEIGKVDTTAFIKDGMLDSAEYDENSKSIVLIWNSDSGKTNPMSIPVGDFVTTYDAGSGLTLTTDNKFEVKIDTTNTNNKVTINDNGLLVDISSDITALENTMDDKIEAAFNWINV